ncbi:glycosyltransferase [Kribbella sp. NPDC026611]|uniref:glycosyltransferase n=1 Tax=Kribbella sp. NPDC026611 TaxID=3154911 RepID=UPI0033D86A1D
MKVVLTAWGSRGDVEPLTGLAVALQKLEVEVRLCVPADDEFTDLLASLDLPLVPLGPTAKSVVSGSTPPAERAFQLARELVAARFETLSAAAADGYDAIVATGLMPAGARDVADKFGLHYVLATFHLAGLPSQRFRPGARPGTPSSAAETDLKVLWEQDAQRVNGLYQEAVNQHRADLGMPPVDNVRDYVLTDRPWLAADPTLCPSEGMTELDVVQTGAWIRHDSRPLPDELQSFLDAGEPPVYVGLGSMAAYAPKSTAPAAIEAIRARGRRVVVARGWAGLDAVDDADDCLVIGTVNHQALFPRMAAIVHHGGAGTTTAAARAGVPQVIVPLIADQPYWAGRVVDLGIGAAHQGKEPTPASVSASLDVALADETQVRARAVAEKVRGDGAMVAAELLVKEMSERR